jgi:hypothetical protein
MFLISGARSYLGEKMIIVFLIILIMVLIIANILVSISRNKPNNEEKGFAAPAIRYEEPEVIEETEEETPTITPVLTQEITPAEQEENPLIIAGAVKATNKKIELLTGRVATLEKVVAHLVEKKINSGTEGISED